MFRSESSMSFARTVLLITESSTYSPAVSPEQPARGTASRAVTKSSIARRGDRFIVMVLSLGSRPARARDPKHIVNNRAERQLFPCRPDKGIGAKSKVDYSRERMSLRRWSEGPGGGCRGRDRSDEHTSELQSLMRI